MEEEKKSRSHSLDEIVEHLRRNSDFILIPHVFIDGDDLGSMIALSLGLTRLGKKCLKICHESVPSVFRFLPGVGEILSYVPARKFDSAILIECTNPSRLPRGMNVRDFARNIVNIDHHPGNSLYGDLNYVDCQASAVGEIVYEILKRLGIPLCLDIATSIYVSLLTDTGGFQFANTTARTHQIVSELLTFPIKVDLISREVFHGLSFRNLKLRGEVIGTLESECGGKLVLGIVTQDMMRKWKVDDEGTQQLIEEINVLRDAEIVVLLKETMNEHVRVSMRSKKLPVNVVAGKYAGGGHMLAAGCTLPGTLQEVKAELLKTLKSFITNYTPCE